MHFDIRQKDVRMTQILRDCIARRIEAALERFSSRIRRITLHLSDVNGPRGGVDKLCRVAVQLEGGEPIRTEGRGSEWLSLATEVAKRAAHSLTREVDRRRDGLA